MRGFVERRLPRSQPQASDEIRRKRQIAPRPTSANQLMLLDLTGFDIMKIEWMREGTAEAVEKE